MAGVVHYLRTGFADFMSYSAQEALPAQPNHIMYRDQYHSFWHDDPNDKKTQEKYQRRIQRFLSIDAKSEPVLFVHAVNHTDELDCVDDLLQELCAHFGHNIKLLLIIDYQRRLQGPAIVHGRDNLLVYFVPDAETRSADPAASYCVPIECGVDWVEGRTINMATIPSVNMISTYSDPYPPVSPFNFRFFEDAPNTAQTTTSLMPTESIAAAASVISMNCSQPPMTMQEMVGCEASAQWLFPPPNVSTMAPGTCRATGPAVFEAAQTPRTMQVLGVPLYTGTGPSGHMISNFSNLQSSVAPGTFRFLEEDPMKAQTTPLAPTKPIAGEAAGFKISCMQPLVFPAYVLLAQTWG